MALPTTIASVALVTGVRCCGPFNSAAGNVYVVLIDSADNSLIEVHKATDPTSSFSEVDGANRPNLTNNVLSIACTDLVGGSKGDTIHIVTKEASTGRIGYHTFSMASDAWGTINEQVTATTNTPNTASIPEVVGIGVRSDGDVIVNYQGALDTVTMSDFSRVKYARREGGSWTVNVAVDNAGAVDWLVGDVVMGSSDRAHHFFLDDTNDDAYQRCLRSDNTLETFPAAFDGTVQSGAKRADIGPGVAYVSGGTTKVRAPYEDATGAAMAQCDSADTPSMSTSAFTTAVTARPSPDGTYYLLAAVAKLTDLYALWVDSTSLDLIRDLNSNDGGWGTDTTEFTSTSVNRFFANVIERGGNYKLAYVLNDNGTIKYNELDLGSTSGTAVKDIIMPGMIPFAR